MDPNETLRRIRELSSTAIADDDRDCNISNSDARELAELFQSLDEWLTKGGFQPAAWSHFTTASVR